MVVKEFYARVLKNGDIYRANYEGLYCINCEEYKVPFNFLISHLMLYKIFFSFSNYLETYACNGLTNVNNTIIVRRDECKYL